MDPTEITAQNVAGVQVGEVRGEEPSRTISRTTSMTVSKIERKEILDFL